MNKKLTIQLFAGVLFLISGFIAFVRGVFEPSEHKEIAGAALILAGAYLLYTEDGNRRELKPVRVRARN